MITRKDKAFRNDIFQWTGFKPHPAQKRVLNLYDNSRFLVCVMGRKWGKTELAINIVTAEVLKPNKKIGLVGPSYRDADRIFKGVWKNIVEKDGVVPQAGSSKTSNILIMPEVRGGSEIHSVSTDSITSPTSSRGLGESYDLLVLDEAAKMPPTAWRDYLRPSLADRRGSALFITSPWGYNYIYDLYILGQEDRTGVWASITSPTWENTAVFSGYDDPEIQEFRENNSKESFDQAYGARFTSMSGRVFNDFSREQNVIETKYDPNLPLYVSLDFGYNFPCASYIQTCRENSREVIRVVDETMGDKWTDEQFFNALEANIKQKGYKVTAWVGDSSGANAQSQTGVGPITYARRRGINIQTKTDRLSKSIEAGIELVRKAICNAEGHVGLYVDPSCKEFIRSFEGYILTKDKSGNGKDIPLKDNQNDHFPDNFRYWMVWKYPLTPPGSVSYLPRKY